MRERPSGGVLLPGAALLGGYAATAEISVSERMAIAGRHKVGVLRWNPRNFHHDFFCEKLPPFRRDR